MTDIRVARELADSGIAFQNPGAYEKTQGYRDQSLTWVMPTTGWIHVDVVDSWAGIDWPMNQIHTGCLRANKMEVGEAYNFLFKLAADLEFCRSKFNDEYSEIITGTRFVWTTEQDNIIPPNAVLDLMASIYTCPDCGEPIGRKLVRSISHAEVPIEQRVTLWQRFCAWLGHPIVTMQSQPRVVTSYEEDPELLAKWQCAAGHRGYDAVSGLYHTKTLPPRPMAYGDPKSGPDDMTPQAVEEHVRAKTTMEVNGIGMGCAIWRKALFSEVSEPWFQTVQKESASGIGGGTQDLFFCKKAKAETGARFGVHCGVRVGHVDKNGRRF